MDNDISGRRNLADDSDMKIAGNRPKSQPEPDAAAEYEFQKESGNIVKACRLGATLAGRAEEIAALHGTPEQGDTAELHRKLLNIFAMVSAVETYLPDRILVRACLNVFYDTLKKENPTIYDSMSASGAFTFYYLEYRRTGDKAADIGSAYAMLCGSEDDESLKKSGNEIFVKTCDYVRSIIDEMAFAHKK